MNEFYKQRRHIINKMTDLINELVEDKVYEVNIGKSFQNAPKLTYHQFKCK